MSNFLIALLVSIGIGTWVYTKMMKTSGGLTKNALIVAGVCAFIAFLILLTILGMLL